VRQNITNRAAAVWKPVSPVTSKVVPTAPVVIVTVPVAHEIATA
jgi:hypothetical protein